MNSVVLGDSPELYTDLAAVAACFDNAGVLGLSNDDADDTADSCNFITDPSVSLRPCVSAPHFSA